MQAMIGRASATWRCGDRKGRIPAEDCSDQAIIHMLQEAAAAQNQGQKSRVSPSPRHPDPTEEEEEVGLLLQ